MIPKVDFLGEAGERGPKTLSKQMNQSVLLAPHPTSYGKDINPTRQVDKSKAVGLVDSESKNWIEKSVETYIHFFRGHF